MAKKARTRTRVEEDDQLPDAEPMDDVSGDGGPEPEAAPAASDNPEGDEVPLSAGKGGRYTMKDGRRVLRTD